MSEGYVSIYNLIAQGDEMLESSLRSEAAEFYSEARRKLIALRSAHPNWNRPVVQYRLNYLEEKLADLPLPEAPPLPADGIPTPSADGDLGGEVKMLEGQLAALNEQLRQLTADNALLLAKLREAMSARPADADPAEVRRAEARILELEKENELIELQLKKALQPDAESGQSPERTAAVFLPDSPDKVEQLQNENQILKQSLAQYIREPESAPVSLASLGEQVQALSQERDTLRRLLAVAEGVELRDAIERLIQENAVLKAATAEALRPAEPEASALVSRVQSLEKEKSELQAQLAEARRSKPRESRGWLPRIGRRGSQEVSFLKARLAVFEAEKEPYNSEELALLKGVDLEAVVVSEKANSTLGRDGEASVLPGVVQLESAARTAAREGRFDEAEAKFVELLDLVPNHAPTLASLALTQMKQQKFGEAEVNLEAALEAAPENAYALFLTGLLNISQGRYEKAVTFLSRAAVLDSDDAETQNYLGVALTETGHRGPAEAALRKAIRLRRGYTDAHINLAIVYASQSPSYKELAKYHYQQAINAGHPAVPRIEQMLSQD